MSQYNPPALRVAKAQYRVANGGSIFNCRSRRLVAGEVVSIGPDKPFECSDYELPLAAVRDHVKNGYLVPVNSGTPQNPDHFAVDTSRDIGAQDMPGIPAPPSEKSERRSNIPTTAVVPGTIDQARANASMSPPPPAMSAGVPGGPTVTVSPPARTVPPAVSPPTPWTLNPENLRGKTLDELNVMIFDRMSTTDRPSFTKYTDVNAAASHLTRDFAG